MWIAFKVGGIDDVDNQVRLGMEQVVTGDDLLLGVGGEGVGARQIHQANGDPVVLKLGLLLLDGNPRPVADVQTAASDGIDQGRFAGVGVAGHRHGDHPLGHGLLDA